MEKLLEMLMKTKIMEALLEVLLPIWANWLEKPLFALKQYVGIDWTEGRSATVCKAIMVFLLLLVLYKLLKLAMGIFIRISGAWRICQAIADRCASAGRPMVAARWYKRAGNYVRQAEELAKAGLINKAIHLLIQQGDFCSIGRIYEATEDFSSAAAMYLKANDRPSAALVMARCGKFEEALRMFCGFFEEPWDPPSRLAAAKKCWQMLGAKGGCAAVPAKFRKPLLTALADCLGKAGECYQAGIACLNLGRFEEALGLFNRIQEGEKWFDASRILTGQCLCELHDYQACRDILSRLAEGKSVNSANLELFYMLGVAEEGLAHLAKSREIFRQILAIDPNYRDTARRKSSISSRISIIENRPPEAQVRPRKEEIGTMETQLRQLFESQFGGKYLIKREIGRGGMGVVYLATDKTLGRPVALKSLKADMIGSAALRERFIQEARSASRLTHPNIVVVYEVGVSGDDIFIAMEYVEGQSLHKYIRSQGFLSPRDAVDILKQACAALVTVHKAGIIHRDIKPENLLLDEGGRVKLTDFGLAKDPDVHMTVGDDFIGTVPYAAPEQLFPGRNIGPKADVYALGLVLDEALTGMLVFPVKTVSERLAQPKPELPSKIRREIPEELDAIVAKCLEDKPEDRYSAEELLSALQIITPKLS